MDAREFTLTNGGRWYGRYGAAPCPCCQPERRRDQSALSIMDGQHGKLVLHCFKTRCRYGDILDAVGIGRSEYRPPDPAEMARRAAERQAETDKRSRQARAVWEDAQPIAGTVAETYLRGRGITCALPPTLVFAPSCWHASAKRFPALVALVEGGEGFALHRTYLRPDGAGKAEADPSKAMLGAVAGGAVRLAQGPGRLVVAEGIETALSLACGLLDGPATVWAALSTSGMTGLRLPDIPGRLTVAPDGDKAGRGAALALADRAARAGWAVSILTPPPGGDFNDLLRGELTA